MKTKLFKNVSLMSVPVEKEDIVNKEYVDNAINRKVKDAVVAVCVTNIDATYRSADKTLTQTTAAEFEIDGVTLNLDDRILIAGQTDATQNGIYVVTTLGVTGGAVGVLTRSEDFDGTEDLSLNLMIPIQKGTQNGDTTFIMTNDSIPTIDTDSITFAKFKGSNGANIFTTTFTGDGVAKEFTITHGLGTENVTVTIKDSNTKELCYFGVTVTSSNVITISSDVVLESSDSFDVVVLG